MQRLLGEVEVTEKAHECGEHSTRLGSIDEVDLRASCGLFTFHELTWLLVAAVRNGADLNPPA